MKFEFSLTAAACGVRVTFPLTSSAKGTGSVAPGGSHPMILLPSFCARGSMVPCNAIPSPSRNASEPIGDSAIWGNRISRAFFRLISTGASDQSGATDAKSARRLRKLPLTVVPPNQAIRVADSSEASTVFFEVGDRMISCRLSIGWERPPTRMELLPAVRWT